MGLVWSWDFCWIEFSYAIVMASNQTLVEPDYTALSDFIDDSDKFVHTVV